MAHRLDHRIMDPLGFDDDALVTQHGAVERGVVEHDPVGKIEQRDHLGRQAIGDLHWLVVHCPRRHDDLCALGVAVCAVGDRRGAEGFEVAM